MSANLPYPNSPQNGDAGNADPVRLNLQALLQAIQSFDGTQMQAKSIQEAALADSINPRLRDSEMFGDFVVSGCVWTSGGGLNGSMTGGTVYINGYRTLVNSVGSKTFTASQDTYVAVDYLGNITYSPVANNAAAPSLPANSIWIAKIITNASAVATVQQNGGTSTDPIYPGSPIDFDLFVTTGKIVLGATTIQYGWGYVTGTGGTFVNGSVVFGTPFSGVPYLTLSSLGRKDGIPTDQGDFPFASDMWAHPNTITATSFFLTLESVSATAQSTGRRFGYSWIAIGPT